jgi:hypothetical protein
MSPSRAKVRVIAPREPKAAKPRKPKAAPQSIEHVAFGVGRVLAVRQVDGTNGYIADLKFHDGVSRTIRLDQVFWVNDINPLIPMPPKPRRATG